MILLEMSNLKVLDAEQILKTGSFTLYEGAEPNTVHAFCDQGVS